MPSGCEKVKLGLLRKQLSLGSLTRKISRTSAHASSAVDEEEVHIRQHLLEEAEPVSTVSTVSDSNAQEMNKERSKSAEIVQGSAAAEAAEPKHKVPSSMIRLTETEKRELEDVLMRIGLKDCGL